MDYSLIAKKTFSWQRSGWGSKESQENRFRNIFNLIKDLENINYLLDFGCNDGKLFEIYPKDINYPKKLIGYDPCKEAIENFNKRKILSSETFSNKDDLRRKYQNKIDLVLCCGILQIKKLDWKEVLYEVSEFNRKNGYIIISTLSLDWNGFKDSKLNLPNTSNRWIKYEEMKNFLELNLNYKIKKNMSLLPRTGETGLIGFGYDMLILAKKS